MCWANGRLVPPTTPSVSALDHGIIVGDGVFETIQVLEGKPVALTRHLNRLKRSAIGLGLEAPNENTLLNAIKEVLEADPASQRLRITWSSGPGPLSSIRGGEDGTLLLASSVGTQWPSSERVHLSKWTRNENSALVGLKTTSYAENVVALQAAREIGCSEALFLNTAGNVCEGTGTNIFFVIDDVLVTPSMDSGCLAGIIRELVIEITAVNEREIHPAEISEASEAFLTSSTRDISPIYSVDDYEMPDNPGPVTSEVSNKFKALLLSNIDP